jgi:integrase
MVSQQSAYFDKEKRLIYQACRPTDRVGCSLFASGIASRIGDNVTASVALLDRHVRFLMADLEDQYLSARTPRARHRAAQGGLATLLLWLGWLRSSEYFTLKWSDFDVIEPCDGPTADLPLGCGSVDLCIGPKTKSSRARTVSIPVAYQTLSGYHCGKWFH